MKRLKINFTILCFVVLLLMLLLGEAIASNYYASADGAGTSCSQSSPCLINSAWSNLKAGDTLYLLSGTYRGSGSMIYPPSGKSGTSSYPITIKALYDGKVTIDGESINRPVALVDTNWIIVEGVNAKNGPSEYAVVTIAKGSNNIVRRVVAWDSYDSASTGQTVFLSHAGTDNLFEDVAGWGYGRKILGLLNDTRTTFRRGFFRFTGHSGTVYKWKVGLTIGYYSDSTTVENCIGTWDRESGNDLETYAIFGGDGGGAAGTVKVYGNIGYFLSSQSGTIMTVFGSGDTEYPNVNIKDTVMVTDKMVNTFTLGKVHVCDYCTSIGGNTYSGGTRTNSLRNPSISSLGGDILQYNSTTRPSSGAWIRYRYEDGKLTNTPLWPWPMEERIKEALVSSGYASKGGIDGKGGTSVTKTVFELGGGTVPNVSSSSGDTIPPSPPNTLMIE